MPPRFGSSTTASAPTVTSTSTARTIRRVPSSPGSAPRHGRTIMRIGALTAAFLIGGSSRAFAQVPTPPAPDTAKSPITLALEAGVRAFTKEPSALEKGKFEEYRDMRSGLVVPQLRLAYNPAGSIATYAVSGRNLFQRNQSMWAE